ncbi:hypothetical protein VP01_2030g5 [Puccinia sorghi]|uniref:PHD finger-like domain-containing protein 5A n=1 Tax=Puccinia sorghi TaxID=27349 RepID=A0A0L6VB45_9BASI|nr:hypothetical protein VP01_2030g5 [Puccinia sorghi]
MSKHHPDLIQCRKQPGIAIARMCEKCDGKCPICDSYVRPQTLVRICDECNFGTYGGRCIICGSPGISDAYYYHPAHNRPMNRYGMYEIGKRSGRLSKDLAFLFFGINFDQHDLRDIPGASRTDLFYERKRLASTSIC